MNMHMACCPGIIHNLETDTTDHQGWVQHLPGLEYTKIATFQLRKITEIVFDTDIPLTLPRLFAKCFFAFFLRENGRFL